MLGMSAQGWPGTSFAVLSLRGSQQCACIALLERAAAARRWLTL